MNVNLNSLQRTTQNQGTQEIQKASEGKLGDSTISVGDAKPKLGETFKTFFSNLKTAITSRFPKIANYFHQRAAASHSKAIDSTLKPRDGKEDVKNDQKMFKESVLKELVNAPDARARIFGGGAESNKKILEQKLLPLEKQDEEQALSIRNELVKQNEKDPDDVSRKLLSALVGGSMDANNRLSPKFLGNAMQEMDSLLKSEIKADSNGKVNEGTILRSNSAASAYATGFARAVGGEYVSAVLEPVMKEIKEQPPLFTNPKDIPGSGSEQDKIGVAKENAQKLGVMLDNLLDRMLEMDEKGETPQELKNVSALVHAAVKRAGGEDSTARIAGGSIIFLRLLNPSLTAPHLAPTPGSLTVPPVPQLKTATSLSILFQALANGKETTGGGGAEAKQILKDVMTVERFDKVQSLITRFINGGVVPENLSEFAKKTENVPHSSRQTNTPPQVQVENKVEEMGTKISVEETDEEVGTEEENEIFDVINQDGGGFREEDSEVKGTTQETVQRNQEENSEIKDIFGQDQNSEFIREAEKNIEDMKNKAFIEESDENVGDLEDNQIFDVINQDGHGFQEEVVEIKDIKQEFVQRNKEEDELMNELLNMKKN